MFLGEDFQAVSIEPESDPATYEDAMANVDSNNWVKTMKATLVSMNSDQVWDLLEALDNIKSIGCKWVYKRNRGFDGKVKTFKARLVAKGYTQREGMTMRKPFRQ